MREPTTPFTAPRLLLVACCAEQLATLRADTPGLASATIATLDGTLVASTLADREQADKLAAMASSISALSAALTREAGHGEPERVTLESSEGQILTCKVSDRGAGLVLLAVADRQAVLGTLLWQCKAAAERIRREGDPLLAPTRAAA